MLGKKKKRPIVTLEQARDGRWIYKEGFGEPYKDVDDEAMKKYPWFKKWVLG